MASAVNQLDPNRLADRFRSPLDRSNGGPDTRVPVTVRLDRDVVNFFKDYGKGYQTRINKILRVFMEHEQEGRRTDG